MNFYKLRLINTLLLFLVGILIGLYIGVKKDHFKFIFDNFDDYKPIYYGKKKTLNESSESSYIPVYYNNDKLNFQPQSKKTAIHNDRGIYKDSLLLDTLKNSSNPIDDDLEVYIESSDESGNDDFIDIYEFVLDPLKNKGKKIRAEKILLLKGEKKNDDLYFYFLIKEHDKEYYLSVSSKRSEFRRVDIFKIGYYYKVDFLSTLGSLMDGNRLIRIEELDQKADWATGISAF